MCKHRAHTHTHIHAHTRVRAYKHTHTCTHTHAHVHTHTHTHTHTLSLSLSVTYQNVPPPPPHTHTHTHTHTESSVGVVTKGDTPGSCRHVDSTAFRVPGNSSPRKCSIWVSLLATITHAHFSCCLCKQIKFRVHPSKFKMWEVVCGQSLLKSLSKKELSVTARCMNRHLKTRPTQCQIVAAASRWASQQ